MKILLIIFLVCVTSAKSNDSEKSPEKKCEGIHVHDKFHKKDVIGIGLNRPYQLAYDHGDHKIFFSYNTGKDDEDSFEIGYIEKGHIKHKVLPSVENGFAIAIDNKDNLVYFGGSEGIYKQHLKTNGSKVEKVISHHNIWDMFFKHHLYFIEYPSQKLYKCEHDKTKIKIEHQKVIHEKIFQFAIDGDDDMFITNETGLYRIKNGTDHRIHYDGPKIYRAIEIDNKGVAHFSGQNGIFIVNKENDTLEKIAHIKNIFGLAFDNNNNIVYSDPHEIVKLLPEEC
ncbi:ommochrome-binding protein-like [Vanessa tameamea]|uniref:Ommochrome-binding protein-like n=1 Tax=Vanessa tameamea TaxID=334116 RepID=A0A8B8HI88_VANTA